MSKILVAVGVDFPGDFVESVSVNSDHSLLDADIIFFRPELSAFPSEKDVLGHRRTYQGDRWLSEEGSFALQRAIAHWRSQLKIAHEASKTIIIFLAPYENVYVDTGGREHSGTGRNRHTTVMLDGRSNYEFLPLDLKVTATAGKGIKIANDLGFLTPLWHLLREHVQYRVLLEGKGIKPILFTRTGDKIVGGILAGKGTLVLWPDLNSEKFFTEAGSWTKMAKQLGHQLVSVATETDRVAHAESDVSPTPDWTTASEFRLREEEVIQNSILSLDSKIERLLGRRQSEQQRLSKAGTLRSLLFEKGPRLESAVRDALRILGFKADGFKEGEHEFDAVFESPEGRFVGEVEGRDEKGIAISKLSQLERNLQEDYTRDEVNEYAKGVLFGNAERLLPLEKRGEFFTDKVLSGARRTKIALVRTPDLFKVAMHIKDFSDLEFAKRCRLAIADSEGGIVNFPKPQPPDDTPE